MDGAPDVVEEVMRITGFDAIASVPLPRADGVAKPTATPEQLIERRLRRAAAAAGFVPAVTWSFISDAHAAPFGSRAWSRSEEQTSETPSLMPTHYSAVC